MTLEVEAREEDGVPVLALFGELDISQTAQVEHELRSLERQRPAALVLDLSGLTFLDSSGLRLILEADQRSQRSGRRLAIIPGPERVHRVFLVALLDRRLEFVATAADLKTGVTEDAGDGVTGGGGA